MKIIVKNAGSNLNSVFRCLDFIQKKFYATDLLSKYFRNRLETLELRQITKACSEFLESKLVLACFTNQITLF